MYTIITGASRGIGKSLAYKFAEHNYDLLLTCEKNIDLLEQIKTDIEILYDKLSNLRSWMFFLIGANIAFSIYFIYIAFFEE